MKLDAITRTQSIASACAAVITQPRRAPMLRRVLTEARARLRELERTAESEMKRTSKHGHEARALALAATLRALHADRARVEAALCGASLEQQEEAAQRASQGQGQGGGKAQGRAPVAQGRVVQGRHAQPRALGAALIAAGWKR